MEDQTQDLVNMHFDIEPRTIYLARHGSHAYGTNLPDSDIDLRGAAIAPRTHVTGFAYTFEQNESKIQRDEFGNAVVDQVIYDLRKFMNLAADCNPNVLEVLFVDDSDIVKITPAGQSLRELRYAFLSKKAKHTFTGYAIHQLKRIRTHRGWLLNPPGAKPERKDFGLPENVKITPDMLGAYDKLVDDLKEEGYAPNPNVQEIVGAEKRYHAAMQNWNSYQSWKKQRNPARAELEAKFGYDTKHAMHLVRLLRMCREILSRGEMIVKRPDAEELLAIRRGAWKYDDLIAWAEQQDAEMQELYAKSELPRAPNVEFLNLRCCDIQERFWAENP